MSSKAWESPGCTVTGSALSIFGEGKRKSVLEVVLGQCADMRAVEVFSILFGGANGSARVPCGGGISAFKA